ncbi:hypothetical protein T8K17_12840 [Thalassobaculum sp. OXR-137]|uniref:hypothetical protein n=1 Tax=Thalassobaculum sp. OXR-137 TaxID=3100173 RepID=UPI002AC8AA1C|nr:hypothetical protein [Thalassobaculum sp. OXR-137]WPZ37013.1 hypothetical protein T8K17_12840 [Thalassobaculum sp. OXR-137]
MGEIVAFQHRPRARAWSAADLRALDLLVARLPAATGWELEPCTGRAFITGAEDETLLIVGRTAAGLAVASGWERTPHWHGPSLERYG